MPDDTSIHLAERPRGREKTALARFVRSVPGVVGLGFLLLMVLACVLTMPWTLSRVPAVEVTSPGVVTTRDGPPRYAAQDKAARHLPPSWWPSRQDQDVLDRLRAVSEARSMARISLEQGEPLASLEARNVKPTAEQTREAKPFYLMGTDVLGQDLFVRVLAGGGISLAIGIAAATLSVFLGTAYGVIAGYFGGRVDGVMMRIVDVLYGLPYVLLVVLLAVAGDALMDEYISRSRARAAFVQDRGGDALAIEGERGASKKRVNEWLAAHPAAAAGFATEAATAYPPRNVSESTRTLYDLGTLLVAIGGVSWLTMARVIRGQVLSLKAQPFIEAARAMGVPLHRQFLRHLLPNLLGPIIVYATLTVPQAVLQESFLSFLGIGVRPPLPSWGNLAADGLPELNPYKSRWWLLFFPCVMLGSTLLALNFVGEGLREALDPKRSRR